MTDSTFIMYEPQPIKNIFFGDGISKNIIKFSIETGTLEITSDYPISEAAQLFLNEVKKYYPEFFVKHEVTK